MDIYFCFGAFVYKFLCRYMFPFLMPKHLGAELLGHNGNSV